ncbi:MAG: malate synthase A [Polyangiales bacterium]
MTSTKHALTVTGSLLGPAREGYASILTDDALAFVESLVRAHAPRIEQLLAARADRQKRFDAGELPDFLPETAELRARDWTVAPLPTDLLDRRVEITGPVDRKMIINALNSGAFVFMADFEDATAPTWDNLLSGQVNLRDAVRRSLTYTAPETGKAYKLNDKTAVLFVRPRGFHLPERHVLLDGRPIPGSLFDFGLYFFHNAREAIPRGTGPYFYLPKLESHLEARVWNDVFVQAQDALGIPQGTVKATVLIETLPATFELDEILWELKDHSAGLNCGRWDYIFSFIKKFRSHADKILPDRGQVTMDKAFLRAYSQLVIKTCHRRNVHAMGGMAAQIPIKGDDAANEAAMARVRADKNREAGDGHDGTWVAHPGLVPIAREIFDARMPGKNQIDKKRLDVNVTRDELIAIHDGTRTEAGLRHNIRVGIQYTEAWLGGLGCVPLYNLMEDAATAEISRAQVWQWLKHQAPLDGGAPVSRDRFKTIVDEELARIRGELGEARFEKGQFPRARAIFEALSTAPEFQDFLTLPAYEALLEGESRLSS